jgi:predicted enzyme related to lactoylglutathione lyase
MGGEAGPAAIGFIEIPARDPEASARFFEAVFGWEWRAKSWTGGSYVELDGVERKVRCALVPASVLGHGAPTAVIHLTAAQLATCLEKIRTAGGTVVAEPEAIDDQGLFGRFRDPDGNLWGLWAPAAEPVEGS